MLSVFHGFCTVLTQCLRVRGTEDCGKNSSSLTDMLQKNPSGQENVPSAGEPDSVGKFVLPSWDQQVLHKQLSKELVVRWGYFYTCHYHCSQGLGFSCKKLIFR